MKPPKPLRAYTVPEVEEWTQRLSDVVGKKGQRLRGLAEEEQGFIINELVLTKASFAYWAERYCYINVEGVGVERLYPLWDSQKLLLEEIASQELRNFEGEKEDGILVNCLKARQLGASTFGGGLVGHRASTQNNLQGLIASDVPGPSGAGYLFGMFERVIDHLPWFLSPDVTDRVKDTEIAFDGGTHVWVGAGKSMKGTEGRRGQLGRGKTLSLLQLSELSTWDDPGQIDDALMPTVPRHPRTLAYFESTAKGRNNWWHRQWKKSVEGVGRFLPIFIPWYAEPTKYRMKAPEGWEPAQTTVAHAEKARLEGPRWCHRPVELTREQLYWYEKTRAEFEADDNLTLFLEEYAANPEEAFQYSGKSIFSSVIQQRIQDQMKPLRMVMEVAPMREIV